MKNYSAPLQNPYKLRIYYVRGVNKGNLRTEEFFPTLDALRERYFELTSKKDYEYVRPTAWYYSGLDWEIMHGY